MSNNTEKIGEKKPHNSKSSKPSVVYTRPIPKTPPTIEEAFSSKPIPKPAYVPPPPPPPEPEPEPPTKRRRTRKQYTPVDTQETLEQPENNLPASGDFPQYLIDRMDKCLEDGILKGYIYREYVERVRANNPLVRPDHVTAAILRQKGLADFKFYLEVLTDFPIHRNNKRLIVHPDGKQEEKEATSVYEEICNILDMAESEKKKYVQFSIPRDLMKTTIATRYMGWLYLRDTITTGRAPIIMFLCHKQNFAVHNLNLCMKVLNDELIRTLYSDILRSEVTRSTEVRFTLPGAEYAKQIKRKESHFMTGSSEMSFESTHCTYIHVDDWCTWENCSTIEMAAQNIAAFHKLDFLNDNSGLFRIIITNTMHFDDDVNARYIEQTWGPFICRGAEDILDDGSKVYNFPENPDYSPEGIELYRKKHDAQSINGNILMKPSKRRTAVVITDMLPDYEDPFKKESVDAIRHVCLTLDPAYSHKRKKQGCLQALLVLVNTGNGLLYAHDGFLGRGLSPMQMIDRIAVFIQNYNAKELIVETNAMQGWIATSIYEQLLQKGVDRGIVLTTAYNSQDKVDNISAFLEPLVRRGKLYVSNTLRELSDEIYGKSKYMDGMDALSFARFSRFIDLSDPPPRTIFDEEQLYSQSVEEQLDIRRRQHGIQQVCPWVE